MHVPADPSDNLLSTKAAASRLGIAEVTLRIWRWQRNPNQPPWIRVGSRTVKYDPVSLDAWQQSRTQEPGRKADKKSRDPRRQQRRRGPQ
jgi:predicted DNA-binding transcriptional regulator AlpA